MTPRSFHALAAGALLVALAAAGAPLAVGSPIEDPPVQDDAPREQGTMGQLQNDTYDALREAQPHVGAVALPILHCPGACYRSLGPFDHVAFAPLIERERASNVYEDPNVTDRWSLGETDVGGGALEEEESSSESTSSSFAPNGTRTDDSSSYRTLSLASAHAHADAVESESSSTTTQPNATSTAAEAHAGAASARTAGLPVGVTASASGVHARDAFHNATSDAESSTTGGVAALAFDDAQGTRHVVVLSAGATSDHVGKTTVIRIQLTEPVQGGAAQELALPLVLP